MKRGLIVLVASGVLAGCVDLPAPILQSDAVKTEAEAIRIAEKSCGHELNIPSNWKAHLEGEYWVAKNEEDPNTYIAMRILKSDGSGDTCEIAFTAD